MTTFARIAGGLATDVTTVYPFEIFHPVVAATFHVVPDDTVTDQPMEEAQFPLVEPPPAPPVFELLDPEDA